MTDEQDEISENFLRMYNEPITVAEKFGPAILTVPENIRKQADELFKPSEINPNEIFDWVNTKVSCILSSSYQQYLKSIPLNVSIFFITYAIIIVVYFFLLKTLQRTIYYKIL